jgi:SAM-dependent methyltransferase
MNSGLQAICAEQAACKCCGATAFPYGVVDFRKVLDVSGVPIYYYRCPACRFLFTTAFDHFTTDDFLRHVYNEEYHLVDPDYREERSRANAALLTGLFSNPRPHRILDYGGGNGTLANRLRAAGFPRVETYDPFVPDYSDSPDGRFDCVVSFEVVEHSTDPERTFAEMGEFLADPGLIVFSTLLQPPDIDRHGLNWWYAGPRNGHVSLFSRESLRAIVEPLGFGFGSFNDNLHVLFREVPPFAKHFIVPLDRCEEETYTSTVLAC